MEPMDKYAVLLVIGLAYVVIDAVLGLVLGRCVVPGLRCPACKRLQKRE